MEWSWTALLMGGGVMGMLAGFWGRIKEFFIWVIGLFLESVDINDSQQAQRLLEYMIAKMTISPFYYRTFTHFYVYKVSDGMVEGRSAEIIGRHSLLFWNGWVPVVIARREEAQMSAGNGGNPPGDVFNRAAPMGNSGPRIGAICRLRFLRGTVDVAGVIAASEKYFKDNYEECKYSRFCIRQYKASPPQIAAKAMESGMGNTHGEDYKAYSIIHGNWIRSNTINLITDEKANLSSNPPPKADNLKHLYYPNHVVELIEELKFWLSTQEWHFAKRIPWRRGWMLYGPPGVGKTALARAFSQDADLPLHVFQLAGMTNDDFTESWKRMIDLGAPCVALIEDFDAVFHGRDNVSIPKMSDFGPPEPGGRGNNSDRAYRPTMNYLTYDVLLNTIDGVDQNGQGVFLIVTTNCLEKIDPAMGQSANAAFTDDTTSTRPGRIDRVIHLKEMQPGHKKEMASWILSEFPEKLQEVHDRIDNDPNISETPAQFQERCSRIALQEKFKQRKV